MRRRPHAAPAMAVAPSGQVYDMPAFAGTAACPWQLTMGSARSFELARETRSTPDALTRPRQVRSNQTPSEAPRAIAHTLTDETAHPHPAAPTVPAPPAFAAPAR